MILNIVAMDYSYTAHYNTHPTSNKHPMGKAKSQTVSSSAYSTRLTNTQYR